MVVVTVVDHAVLVGYVKQKPTLQLSGFNTVFCQCHVFPRKERRATRILKEFGQIMWQDLATLTFTTFGSDWNLYTICAILRRVVFHKTAT